MNWQKYTPETTTRKREKTEWSIFYGYNAPDNETPRVLLIGDSICQGYQNKVRELLDGRVNVTFWASSKCVTDPDYFRELLYMLTMSPYRMICYNNGLHSLGTDRTEWTAAYRSAVRCIRETCPDTKLALTLCTPLRIPEKTEKSIELNNIIRQTAQEEDLPVIDLFSLMDPLNKNEYMSDPYHFKAPAVEMQAKMISGFVLEQLDLTNASAAAEQASSETGPMGKIE